MVLRFVKVIFVAIGLCILSPQIFASSLVYTQTQEDEFIKQYSLRYKLPPQYIKDVLAQARFQQASYNSQQFIPKYKEKTKSWVTYRSQFLNSSVISRGSKFMCEHMDTLTKEEDSYGIPKEIILGIIGIETTYGDFTGNYRVLDSLSTIAFNVPSRSYFFQNELAQYLLMCYQYNLDPTTLIGSIDGGFGLSQFMPSSYNKFAVSATGNKMPNLSLADDAIMSIGYYIKEHSWKIGQPVYLSITRTATTCQKLKCNKKQLAYPISVWLQSGVVIKKGNHKVSGSTIADLITLYGVNNANAILGLSNFYVIYSYNHSYQYVMGVYTLGNAVVKTVKNEGCNK